MQIRTIITQLGLEPLAMSAGSICGKARSIKSPRTENVGRGLGPEQPANPQALRLPGRQDGGRSPAGMRPAESENSFTERWEDGAQRLLGWPLAAGCQTSRTVLLATAAPLADSPDRAAECGGNHRIGFARCSTPQNCHAFGNRSGRSMAQHIAGVDGHRADQGMTAREKITVSASGAERHRRGPMCRHRYGSTRKYTIA